MLGWVGQGGAPAGGRKAGGRAALPRYMITAQELVILNFSGAASRRAPHRHMHSTDIMREEPRFLILAPSANTYCQPLQRRWDDISSPSRQYVLCLVLPTLNVAAQNAAPASRVRPDCCCATPPVARENIGRVGAHSRLSAPSRVAPSPSPSKEQAARPAELQPPRSAAKARRRPQPPPQLSTQPQGCLCAHGPAAHQGSSGTRPNGLPVSTVFRGATGPLSPARRLCC